MVRSSGSTKRKERKKFLPSSERRRKESSLALSGSVWFGKVGTWRNRFDSTCQNRFAIMHACFFCTCTTIHRFRVSPRCGTCGSIHRSFEINRPPLISNRLTIFGRSGNFVILVNLVNFRGRWKYRVERKWKLLEILEIFFEYIFHGWPNSYWKMW